MVTVTWVPPMQLSGSAGRGSTVMMDAAQGDGGTGTGPTPMENLLLALAGCTGMDVVSILRKMRMPLEELRIDVSGERAADHPRVFTSIHLHYALRGAGLDAESVEKAVTLSLDKYCSVAAMLKRTAKIAYDISVSAETSVVAS